MNKLLLKLFSYLFVVCFSFTIYACGNTNQQNKQPIKNVIIMIADGFSPAGATLARYYKKSSLTLDQLLVGTLQTKSTDSLITDSAAAGTAYATGYKTNNGVISLHPKTNTPLKSILTSAKECNMSTGIVVTDKITGATPASFSAHAIHRSLHQDIAEQQLSSNIDLLFGGGKKYFLPKSKSGARTDNQDLIQTALDTGFHYIDNKKDLSNLSQLPALGLFAKSQIDFAIDRANGSAPNQPSLIEMTSKALELLSRNSNGFILMIEGSRVDHAAHGNDAAAFAHEIVAYDKTIELVKNFIDNNPDTLMVSVSDHGTGGITVGADVNDTVAYRYNPTVLRKVKHSTDYLYDYLYKTKSIDKMIKKIGIKDLTADEINRIKRNEQGVNTYHQSVAEVNNIINERSRTGWTTVGHSAIDINLYAYGANSEIFSGNHDNTYVTKTIAKLLGLDLS